MTEQPDKQEQPPTPQKLLIDDPSNFQFHAAIINPDVGVGQNVYLNFEQASARAVESDDGHGKIYTWIVILVLDY